MDFFTDFFNAEELIASVAKAPYIPGMLAQEGIFTTKSLSGTVLAIEEQPLDDASLITSTPRGTPSKAQTLEKRAVHTFETVHYRKDGSIEADSVLNMRAVGVTGAREAIAYRRDEVIAKLRRDMDLTHEYLRMQCLNSPSNVFGNAPASQAIAFGAADSAIRSAIFEKITKPLESALKGIPFNNILAICDDVFWTGLIESKTIRETFLNQSAANSLRTQGTTDAVNFGGVTWVRYRGVGSTVISSGKAKIIPVGVPDMFIQAFAPADTLDSVGVGALGAPYYMSAYPIDNGNRGYYLEMQSNIAVVCTRPTAVLTIGLS
jgi:hypothetical protein